MKRRKRNASGGRQPPETNFYVCDSCGEEIVIPLDPSQGSEQEYVEDCPVCCRPNVIHVEFDEEGESRIWAERE
jgi:DNA replicative helicase MCM subunit Mcm2 (Cdc46/Mcm family)